jgi:hypothetical protein
MATTTSQKHIDLSSPNGIAELESRVRCRLGGCVRDFQLVVGEKSVTLRGRACTYYAKQLAQHTVMEATDIPIAGNEIEVS